MEDDWFYPLIQKQFLIDHISSFPLSSSSQSLSLSLSLEGENKRENEKEKRRNVLPSSRVQTKRGGGLYNVWSNVVQRMTYYSFFGVFFQTIDAKKHKREKNTSIV